MQSHQHHLSDKELANFEHHHSIWEHYIAPYIEYGAEGNYAGCVPITDFTGNYGQFASSFSVSSHFNMGIVLSWNYLDALFAIITGIKQLTDKEDYQQAQLKAKGIINLIAATQLIIFSYNPLLTTLLGFTSATTFAGPAFAVAMGCDFIMAAIDFYNAWKDNSYEGWKEEREKKMVYFGNLIKTYHEKIAVLNTKLAAYSLDPEKNKNNLARINAAIHKYQNKIHITQKSIDEIKEVYDSRVAVNESPNTACSEDHKVDHFIKDKLNQKYEEQKLNLFIKGASFIGMSCLAISPFVAFCPPASIALAIIGMALTTLVAAHYIIKNSPRLIAGSVNLSARLYHGLFTPANTPANFSNLISALRSQ